MVLNLKRKQVTMTDKQIIIDGCNVSGCEFLTKTVHCKAQMSIMGTDTNKCKCFPNCHFKQLKLKKQECEELKEDLRLAKQLVDWILKTFNLESYDWLADQHEISTEIKNIKTKFKSPQVKNFLVEQESGSKSTALYNLETQSDHYRKALEEIETTVKTECEETCGSKLEDCTNFFCSSKHIIDVINKAKG